MRQQSERAGNGENRAQARSFAEREAVVNARRLRISVLRQEGDERTPAAVRAPHRIVCLAELPLGIPYPLDGRMTAQALGQQETALIMPLHALWEGPRLRVQHHGILAPQQFLMPGAD